VNGSTCSSSIRGNRAKPVTGFVWSCPALTARCKMSRSATRPIRRDWGESGLPANLTEPPALRFSATKSSMVSAVIFETGIWPK